MGWITRRIAGSITFTTVAVVLAAYAAVRGWLVGGLTLFTTTGAVILGIAALCSLAVTTHMKHTDQARKAWEAWQDYYVRMYPQYYRRR
jgi:hypothetical protein